MCAKMWMQRFLNVYPSIILSNYYSAVLCLLRELTHEWICVRPKTFGPFLCLFSNRDNFYTIWTLDLKFGGRFHTLKCCNFPFSDHIKIRWRPNATALLDLSNRYVSIIWKVDKVLHSIHCKWSDAHSTITHCTWAKWIGPKHTFQLELISRCQLEIIYLSKLFLPSGSVFILREFPTTGKPFGPGILLTRRRSLRCLTAATRKTATARPRTNVVSTSSNMAGPSQSAFV
jgi:hypothetical protein